MGTDHEADYCQNDVWMQTLYHQSEQKGCPNAPQQARWNSELGRCWVEQVTANPTQVF